MNNEIKKDLSFYGDYVDLFGVPLKKVANLLQCGINKVEDVLNGKILAKEELLEDLYYEYRVKNYDEFEKFIKFEVQRIKSLEEKEELEYSKKNTIEKDELIKQKDLLSEVKNMDKEKLYNLLQMDGMDIQTKVIVSLLFGFINDKYFSIEEIYQFMKKANVQRKQISDLYENSINLILQKLNENDNIKYIYELKE